MNKSKSRYSKLSKEIAVLEYFAYFLLIFLCIALIRALYTEGLKASTELFGELGVLVSVVLVSKVALRQIAHTDMANAEMHTRNTVRVTHHLLSAIDDLTNKISYVEEALGKGGRPLSTVNQCIEDISHSYELLRDKEVHEYVGGDTMGLIWGLSATILGLQTISRELTLALNKQGLNTIPDLTNRTPIESPFSQALNGLQKLDEQVRALRASLEAED